MAKCSGVDKANERTLSGSVKTEKEIVMNETKQIRSKWLTIGLSEAEELEISGA